MLGLAQLLEQTVRPYSANGAQVLAAGSEVELEPSLARALHLVFHELATNANKYGALSSPLGAHTLFWGGREKDDRRVKADALEAELKPLVGGPIVAKMFKYDSNPAHNPQPPA